MYRTLDLSAAPGTGRRGGEGAWRYRGPTGPRCACAWFLTLSPSSRAAPAVAQSSLGP
jgi:hypothetical protein